MKKQIKTSFKNKNFISTSRPWIKISQYINDILSIYRVLESIDTIYSIDNWLTEISGKNRQYRRYIDDIDDFLRNVSKKNNI